MGSCASARPLLEHARSSPGPPSQTNGTELWVLGADHNGQPTAAANGRRPDAARPAARHAAPAEVAIDVAISSQGQRHTLLADAHD